MARSFIKHVLRCRFALSLLVFCSERRLPPLTLSLHLSFRVSRFLDPKAESEFDTVSKRLVRISLRVLRLAARFRPRCSALLHQIQALLSTHKRSFEAMARCESLITSDGEGNQNSR